VKENDKILLFRHVIIDKDGLDRYILRVELGVLPLCGASGLCPPGSLFFQKAVFSMYMLYKEGDNEYGLLQVL